MIVMHFRLNVHGAVATDYTNCSQIGTKILWKGGNAVDAAIAATLCMAVVAPYKTSLGSGGYIMIYSHRDREVPKLIDFLSNTVPDEFLLHKMRIPSMLRGLQYAHTLYGKLLWQEVVEPAIQLAQDGFEISRDFAHEAVINVNLNIFGRVNAGEKLTLPTLAKTLETVSKFGVNDFYNGSLVNQIFSSKNVSEKLLDELANYKPDVILAQSSNLLQYSIFYPSNWNLIKPIVDKLNELNISTENASSFESEIIAAETMIKQMHQLKNPFINTTETRKYTSVSVVDWQDTYVAVTTGLNEIINLAYKTDAGFFFDTFDDKNSLLSLSPIIFYDSNTICGLRGIFGVDDALVAGQILFNLILRSMSVSVAVEYPRYYLLLDGIAIENDDRHSSSRLLRDSLIAIDSVSKVDARMLMKSVNIIIKRKNFITAHSDSRGDGLASRF
ncbi:uncharacterized protein LOC131674242 isoform X2 [Phymastichus coffea]|uniref:uncharacterized protein LOC131674242 isoform X2 n=1 Tax=Phymastichus coffea TaxID=108790 RepID=UPI00273AB3F2|nr:uncharacterized protein LOC131674242 isoform X2 [Phymastichus coffea]